MCYQNRTYRHGMSLPARSSTADRDSLTWKTDQHQFERGSVLSFLAERTQFVSGTFFTGVDSSESWGTAGDANENTYSAQRRPRETRGAARLGRVTGVGNIAGSRQWHNSSAAGE
jgi:hypothetical protein